MTEQFEKKKKIKKKRARRAKNYAKDQVSESYFMLSKYQYLVIHVIQYALYHAEFNRWIKNNEMSLI